MLTASEQASIIWRVLFDNCTQEWCVNTYERKSFNCDESQMKETAGERNKIIIEQEKGRRIVRQNFDVMVVWYII